MKATIKLAHEVSKEACARVEAMVAAEKPAITLTLTEDDFSELYYSFNRRGYSATRVKVAEFLRQVQIRKGAIPFGWYAEITVKPDDENNAVEFWEALAEQFPAIAKELRDNNQASIDAETWNAIQSLKGFRDGPDYARNALIVVGS